MYIIGKANERKAKMSNPHEDRCDYSQRTKDNLQEHLATTDFDTLLDEFATAERLRVTRPYGSQDWYNARYDSHEYRAEIKRRVPCEKS